MFRVLEWVLPSAGCLLANRKVRKRIDGEERDQVHNSSVEALDKAGIKLAYEDAIRSKDKLEDKAKTTVMGTTIAVSLIIGSSGFVAGVNEKYDAVAVKYAFASLVVAAVLYMAAAGVHAIRTLTGENEMYPIWDFGDGHLEENKRRILLNQDKNIIRNNNVFTSYECIRNGLVCLLVCLALLVNPFVHGGQQSPVVQGNFFYSPTCEATFDAGVRRDHVENLIEAEIAGGTHASSPVTIVDDVAHIVVRYSEDAGNVIVYYVDTYAP